MIKWSKSYETQKYASIRSFFATQQPSFFCIDCRTRYELLMLDLVVGRLKTYGHLDEENYKEMKYLIWEFLVERGWARSMPDI